KEHCTPSSERRVSRWEHEAVLEAMQSRLDQAPGQHAHQDPSPTTAQRLHLSTFPSGRPRAADFVLLYKQRSGTPP
ncbi:hypothetical protein ERJ99_019605, partial [Pseudomonas aeruginosa]